MTLSHLSVSLVLLNPTAPLGAGQAFVQATLLPVDSDSVELRVQGPETIRSLTSN